MKKSWKKLAVGSALGLILAGSLAGCSGLKGDATKKKEGASD